MRVLICDDQAIIRDGLALMLKLEKDIEVVGKSRDGAEALELIDVYSPDLVLMDLKMPGMNGIEATRRISKGYPAVRVLVLTTYADDEWVMDALRAGAQGYILKDTPREEVIRAIRVTVMGKSYIDPTVTPVLITRATAKPAHSSDGLSLINLLTPRELDILEALARGMSNTEIAQSLQLSAGTVRNNITAILRKLDVSDRTQAAILAVRHGFGA